MCHVALRWLTTWAKDRATQRCDPSVVPGAESGRAPDQHVRPRFFTTLTHHSTLGTQAINLPGTMPGLPPQDALYHSLTSTRHNSSSR